MLLRLRANLFEMRRASSLVGSIFGWGDYPIGGGGGACAVQRGCRADCNTVGGGGQDIPSFFGTHRTDRNSTQLWQSLLQIYIIPLMIKACEAVSQ